MKTGLEGKPSRTFEVRWSERIYRLHEGGIANHGPRIPGLFEIVLFPPGAEDGQVLYVGQVRKGGTIAEALNQLRQGTGGAPAEALKEIQANMANAYFDALVAADVESEEDFTDVAWAVVQQKKPRLNPPEAQPHSGRYSEIEVKEV
jgi:hypothetical protein